MGALIISARAADSMARSERRTSPAASPSGMKLSALVTRETRPRNPPSASAVMIPSDTPPVRRVSSAISTRPVARHSRKISSAGSGAIQRRSTTRQLIPCLRSRPAARRLIRSPLPNVMMVRSLPSPEARAPYLRVAPIGMCSSAQCSSGAYRASHAPSPSSCRSRS